MKRYLAYYYLLFVLLIMGAFASMAQNEYGRSILGIVGISFGLLFGLQLLVSLNKINKDGLEIFELSGLTILCGLMALRVFNIYFKGAELLFISVAVALTLAYIARLIVFWSIYRNTNSRIVSLVLGFYLSLILYLLSLITLPLVPAASEPLGIAAFTLLILFVVGSWFSKEMYLNGEKISAFRLVSGFKDRSVLLISLFFIFTLYAGFTKIGWLPKMYSSELPQGYYKLLNQAETGKEKPVDGKYKHEEFKRRYDQFVKKHE